MLRIILWLGLLGIVTSLSYFFLTVISAVRFLRRRRRDEFAAGQFTPPASVIKPIHGMEPGLEARLESFFHLDYPAYEILFCAREADDPGLLLAERIAGRHPHISTKIMTSGDPPWPNARCYSLSLMEQSASYPFLVSSDSDVHVAPDYLRAVMQPFSDPQVGVVTCLYRGVPARSFWSWMEAIGMSVEMSSGVLVAEMLAGMDFALGPSMAASKSALRDIGGFAALGQYLADDYMLGNLAAKAGHKVVLSTHAIEHHILNSSFEASMQHQIGWMRSTRFSRPLGHLGTVLTYLMPYGLVVFACLILLHNPALAALCLIACVLCDALRSILVGGVIVHDRLAMRAAVLFSLRDLLGFFFWVAGYLGNEVRWRDRKYRLGDRGKWMPADSTLESE